MFGQGVRLVVLVVEMLEGVVESKFSKYTAISKIYIDMILQNYILVIDIKC